MGKGAVSQEYLSRKYQLTPLNLKDTYSLVLSAEIKDGWWIGRKNGKTGSFPSNFVIEVDNSEGQSRCPVTESDSSVQNQDKPSSDLQDPTKSAHPDTHHGNLGEQHSGKEYYKAMFDYIASTEDELSLHMGDVILVLEKDTEEYGWWEGYVDGNQGLFPDNYVVPYLEDTEMMKGLPPRVGTDVDISAKPDAMATVKAPELSTWKDDHKDEKKDPKSEWSEPAGKSNAMSHRKVPPPVKVKPVLMSLPNKVNGEQGLLPQEHNKSATDRTSDTDSVNFDTLAGSTEKLRHPTTDRPKPKGRRPPTQFAASPIQDVKRSPHPTMPARVTAPTNQLSEPLAKRMFHTPAVKPSTAMSVSSNKQQRVAESEDKATSLAALRAEVRSLQLNLDLVKNLHLRDITDLREEIAEERKKRNALQVEVDKLKKSTMNL
ncbi:SH3 domain-containing protein 21 isoform X2 [Mustelus asterias]